jgi:chromate transporter
MRRDLVDRSGWIGKDEYDEGLAIATACPGPLAYQLGVYCGYITHGVAGALGVALAFAAAPFAIVTGIGALYVRFGSTWELRALFYGIGPVVIAIIIRSCWDLGRKTLRDDRLAWLFAAIACAITVLVQQELIAVFLGAGVLGIVVFYRPGKAAPAPAAPGKTNVTLRSLAPAGIALYQTVPLPDLFWFFFKTGLLVFGSGLVVVPFLKAYVVDQYHWLSNQAFLDAVAVGIGVQGFVRGVTVAVVGVLVGTSYIVARSSIHDAFGLVLLVGALVLLWSPWKLPEPALVGAGALCGLGMAVIGRGPA